MLTLSQALLRLSEPLLPRARHVPFAVQQQLLQYLTARLFAAPLANGSFDLLCGRWLRLQISDLDLSWCLTRAGSGLKVAREAPIDVTIRGNWREFLRLRSMTLSYKATLLITFFLTVIFDLTVAIEVGLVIACVLFMKRVMETTEISVITDEIDPNKESDIAVHEENLMIPKGIEVYEINGPYFFGIATKFEETMTQLGDRPKVRIIRMRKVPFIDSTGIHNLTALCEMSQKEKTTIILSGVNENVHNVLEKAGFYELLGKENICPNINVALERAKSLVE